MTIQLKRKRENQKIDVIMEVKHWEAKRAELLKVSINKDTLEYLYVWYTFNVNTPTEGTGAAVVWKKNRLSKEWQELKISLGQNKEIFDAEVWGISEALRLQNKGLDRYNNPWSLVYFVTLRQSSTT